MGVPPPPAVVRRIMRELKDLEKDPPEGIRIQTNDEDMLDVTGILEGPEGTPYAGGYFRVRFRFSNEFPASPPKCWFATKIFHPNVGSNGEICVNTLKKDWKPEYGIGHILVTVKCLLIYPNPESALDEEAAKLLLEEYDGYCQRAKLITSIHATPRVKPVEFQTPSTPQAESSSSSSSYDSSSSCRKDKSVVESVATASRVEIPTISTPSSVPLPLLPPPRSQNATSPTKASTTTTTTTTALVVPVIVTRKSASPAPPPPIVSSLKAAALAGEKEGGPQKDRHPSPSPLGTADSNVGGGGGKPGMRVGMGMASTTTTSMGTSLSGTRAVKRAATGSAPTNAEKRKKALKRL